MLTSKKIKSNKIERFFNVLLPLQDVEEEYIVNVLLPVCVLNYKVGNMTINEIPNLSSILKELCKYLSYNHYTSYVEIFSDVRSIDENNIFWERFRNINGQAFYKYIKDLFKNNEYELLKLNKKGKETITEENIDGNEIINENENILNTNNLNRKYADTPSGISGDLIDVYTTEQEKADNTLNGERNKDNTKIITNKNDVNINEFDYVEFEKIMYDNTNFKILNDYGNSFKPLFIPFASEELEFEEWL